MNDKHNNISLPLMGQSADSEDSCDTSGCGTQTSHVEAASEDAENHLSVFMETFGCQMNVLDSQLVRGQLHGLGYRFTDNWKSADVILYNTCSVREHAEQKVWSRLGEVKIHKKEHPGMVVGVIGCMAEREADDLIRKYPHVDLMCGPGELDKVPMLIDNVLRTDLAFRGGKQAAQLALQGNTHRRSGTLTAAADQLEMLDLSRSFSPDEYEGSAYVRITRGCNKFCSYCVVPNTRGAEVHRAPENIIDECKRLIDAGVIEITLLGQTVNHYHFNRSAAIDSDGVVQPQIGKAVRGPEVKSDDDITSFAELLHRIHESVPQLKRLRFVTSFPRDFGNDILEVIRDSPRICQYLHLPVQSGSDRMLKMMNRDYEVSEFEDLMARIREYLPDAQVASDLICGFPTESDEDHQMTMDLLKRSMFKNCFIFKYSPRPGTTAYDKLPDDIPDSLKKKRNNELLAIQADNSRVIHEACVGRTFDVFVESVSRKQAKQDQLNQQSDLTGPDRNVVLGWEKKDTAYPSSMNEVSGELATAVRPETLQLAGRTPGDLIVMLDGQKDLVGQVVKVEIERAMPLTLFGRRV